MYSVYKHTSPNGKVYIGITARVPEKRWNCGNGYRNNLHFWNAIQKYGWENFSHEILFSELSEQEAQEIEIRLIAECKSSEYAHGYNRSAGGEPFYQCKHSEETKKLYSLQRKGKRTGSLNPMYGKCLNGEKNGMFGKHHSDEWKKQRSEKYTGAGHPRYGTHLTEKQKETNMKAQPNRKKVCEYGENGELLKTYESIREAARENAVNKSSVMRWCNGEIRAANGHKWAFIKGGA
jgi:group I intron endonuclease